MNAVIEHQILWEEDELADGMLLSAECGCGRWKDSIQYQLPYERAAMEALQGEAEQHIKESEILDALEHAPSRLDEMADALDELNPELATYFRAANHVA